MTAYDVLKTVRSDRPWAPPTAYRALKCLVAEGRVHRIESINAYVACSHDRHAGVAVVIAICGSCGRVEELPQDRLVEKLRNTAKALGFQIDREVIELMGRCAPCASRAFSAQVQAIDCEPRERVPASQSRQA